MNLEESKTYLQYEINIKPIWCEVFWDRNDFLTIFLNMKAKEQQPN